MADTIHTYYVCVGKTNPFEDEQQQKQSDIFSSCRRIENIAPVWLAAAWRKNYSKCLPQSLVTSHKPMHAIMLNYNMHSQFTHVH